MFADTLYLEIVRVVISMNTILRPYLYICIHHSQYVANHGTRFHLHGVQVLSLLTCQVPHLFLLLETDSCLHVWNTFASDVHNVTYCYDACDMQATLCSNSIDQGP
jgi:hypothetical protein